MRKYQARYILTTVIFHSAIKVLSTAGIQFAICSKIFPAKERTYVNNIRNH